MNNILRLIKALKASVQTFSSTCIGVALVTSLLISNPAISANTKSTESSKSAAEYRFDTPRQGALYQKLITQLRCLVCQNQNIADSNAELAKDMREKAAELIRQGSSEQEIKQYMRERFGDFVLYDPPLERKTWLLWAGPFIALIIALFIAARLILRNSAINPVDDEELNNHEEPTI